MKLTILKNRRYRKRMNVLDHGSVELIESWGSDEQIISSARMSTNKGFLSWGPNEDGKPGDEKLLRYLWKMKHSTPFEFCGLTVEVQAPIFVLREWFRHRTFGYSELSARYTPMPDVNYIPTVERLMVNSKTNKQAGVLTGANELTKKEAVAYQIKLGKVYEEAEKFYQNALQAGVPKELARIHLPVGRYSRMRATGNLRNWLGFLTLRMDATAQYEIRVYANTVAQIIQTAFPRTYDLFSEGSK